MSSQQYCCSTLPFILTHAEAKQMLDCWVPAEQQVTTLQYRGRGGQLAQAYLVWALLRDNNAEGRCIYLPPGNPVTCSIPERARYNTRFGGCPFCSTECPTGVLNSGQVISLAHLAGQAEELKRPDLMSTARASDTLFLAQKRGPSLTLADHLTKLGNRWMRNRPLPKQYARRMLKFLASCQSSCTHSSCCHRVFTSLSAEQEVTGVRIESAKLAYILQLTQTTRGFESQTRPRASAPEMAGSLSLEEASLPGPSAAVSTSAPPPPVAASPAVTRPAGHTSDPPPPAAVPPAAVPAPKRTPTEVRTKVKASTGTSSASQPPPPVNPPPESAAVVAQARAPIQPPPSTAPAPTPATAGAQPVVKAKSRTSGPPPQPMVRPAGPTAAGAKTTTKAKVRGKHSTTAEPKPMAQRPPTDPEKRFFQRIEAQRKLAEQSVWGAQQKLTKAPSAQVTTPEYVDVSP